MNERVACVHLSCLKQTQVEKKEEVGEENLRKKKCRCEKKEGKKDTSSK